MNVNRKQVYYKLPFRCILALFSINRCFLLLKKRIYDLSFKFDCYLMSLSTLFVNFFSLRLVFFEISFIPRLSMGGSTVDHKIELVNVSRPFKDEFWDPQELRTPVWSARLVIFSVLQQQTWCLPTPWLNSSAWQSVEKSDDTPFRQNRFRPHPKKFIEKIIHLLISSACLFFIVFWISW